MIVTQVGAEPVSEDQAQILTAADFKLTSIDLYVTSRCNRRCTYCFLPDEFLDSGEQMSLDMVGSILDWASASGTVAEITLLGGEPALHPDFAAILAEIAARGLRARTVTNGSRRLRGLLGKPDATTWLHRVAVSLDAATPAQAGRLRGVRAFVDAIETIDELKRVGIPFDINCTVLRSTADNAGAIIAFAEDLGADRLNMHWFSLVGRARHHAVNEQLTAEEWYEKVLTPVRAYNPKRPDFSLDCELGYSYGLPGEDLSACAVRDLTNLQFFPDGSVYSCGMLVEERNRNAYVWRDGQLLRNLAESEWDDVAQIDCDGCPLRRTSSQGKRPVCIYNRLLK